MKTLAWTIFIILLFNMIALLVNILFSNTILAGITVLSFFITLIWLLKKGLEL